QQGPIQPNPDHGRWRMTAQRRTCREVHLVCVGDPKADVAVAVRRDRPARHHPLGYVDQLIHQVFVHHSLRLGHATNLAPIVLCAAAAGATPVEETSDFAAMTRVRSCRDPVVRIWTTNGLLDGLDRVAVRTAIADGGAVRQPRWLAWRLAGMQVVRFVAGVALVVASGCSVSQVRSGSPSPRSSGLATASRLPSPGSAAASSSPVSAPSKQLSPVPSPPGSSDPSGWAALFTVSGRLSFGMGGPNPALVGIDTASLFLTGAFTDSAGRRATLVRVDRATLRIVATADPPDLTAVAYGGGALWWARGHLNVANGCNCAPPPASRLLLKLDPVSLAVTRRFELPAAPTLVTVTGGNVWVATENTLMRIDPNDGRVLATVGWGFHPVSLAGSADGTRIYVLGGTASDDFVLADADAATGISLARVTGQFATDGPLAVTATGVWVPETDP